MLNKNKIVLVDDDVAFVESNKDLLEAYNYEVYTAYNGEAGLELAKQERPYLMVLDVMMAGRPEGFEIARKIPKTPELQGMKVLLVTGFAKSMNRKLSPDEEWLPVTRILEKPIDPSRLIAEIQKLIETDNSNNNQ